MFSDPTSIIIGSGLQYGYLLRTHVNRHCIPKCDAQRPEFGLGRTVFREMSRVDICSPGGLPIIMGGKIVGAAEVAQQACQMEQSMLLQEHS
jgi:hypothetical protein